MKEFKSFQISNLKEEAKGRVIPGIAAVHGNIDSGFGGIRDRSHLGAFAKTLAEGAKRTRFLWNHNGGQPPIASIVDLKEVGREELPSSILAQFPDATGGLKVWREYYPKDINPISEIIFYGIGKGDINEMSYAYDVVKADYSEEEIGGEKVTIRELRELKLFDLSDVNWGMNPATAANVKGYLELMPLGTLYQQLLLHNEELKAGRRNSSSDETLINQIHELSVSLGALCAPTDDEKKLIGDVLNGSLDDLKQNLFDLKFNRPNRFAKINGLFDEIENSKETESKEAEAGNNSTSLNSEWFELQKRKTTLLEI